jgi:hypothetical protein
MRVTMREKRISHWFFFSSSCFLCVRVGDLLVLRAAAETRDGAVVGNRVEALTLEELERRKGRVLDGKREKDRGRREQR